MLTKKELIRGYKLLGLESDFANIEKEVDAIMANIDVDANGFIDYNEFILCAIDKKRLLNDE